MFYIADGGAMVTLIVLLSFRSKPTLDGGVKTPRVNASNDPNLTQDSIRCSVRNTNTGKVFKEMTFLD